MGLIGTLNSAVTGNIISSADYNENMNAIRNAFNDSAVLMDLARTIVAVHTFSPAAAGPPFILGANAQGQLVSGLNADRLDGEHGAFYLALANATGSLPFGQISGTLSDAQHGNRGGGSLHAAVVAGGASGFMTGADKTKLNGIAAGAQVNTVTSVFGRTGAVVAVSGDYSFGQISGTAAKGQIPAAVAYTDESNSFGGTQTFNDATVTGVLSISGVFNPNLGKTTLNQEEFTGGAGTFHDVALGSSTAFMKKTSSGTSTITGFAGGENGRVLIVGTSSGNVTLKNGDTGSAVGNRIITPSGSDLLLSSSPVLLVYWNDFWRVIKN